MGKRKLTKRQYSRISKMGEDRRQKLASPPPYIIDPNKLGPEEEGLLLANYGRQAEIEAHDGQIVECHYRQNLESPVAGDHIVWQRDSNESGVITAILPRKTVLTRPERNSNHKPIAANITQVIIVLASNPKPTEELIDCYLAACELQHFHAIIVLNKIDLLHQDNTSDIRHLMKMYEHIGYTVIETSPLHSIGLQSLQQILKGQTSIFVGQSGVGKSSLIAALLPHEILRIGSLSTKNPVGKHTTSTTRLYHFPEGGNLIDSPGVRHFQLWKVTNEQILWGFKEFRPFIGQCKFRDCNHINAPDCALIYGVKNGQITSQRLDSYLHIVKPKFGN